MKLKFDLKKIEIIGAVFGFLFGTSLHFFYELSGNSKIVAIFSSVNESVWEHTKMYFFPILIFMAVELYFLKDKKRVLLAKVLESLFGIIFIISFFYTYTGAFGVENVWIDIASFAVAIALGKLISYKIISSKYDYQGFMILHISVLTLMTIFYFTATFIPPKIPLFKDSETGLYGAAK